MERTRVPVKLYAMICAHKSRERRDLPRWAIIMFSSSVIGGGPGRPTEALGLQKTRHRLDVLRLSTDLRLSTNTHNRKIGLERKRGCMDTAPTLDRAGS
eukprot:scaffold105643_cov32-Tisochrysis_lutea.AAC.3